MKLFKSALILLIFSIIGGAQSISQPEINTTYEEEMNLEMCRSLNHRFDSSSHACVYCAQGLRYDADKSQCIGTPDVLGKCTGEDHYRPKTQECIYCANGYHFNEDKDIRECMPQSNKGDDKKS